MKFNKFIRKHLPGLRLLNVSLESYGPGQILTKKRLSNIGTVQQLLTGPGFQWDTVRSNASITYGTITGSRSLKGGLNLLGLISLSGSYANDYSAEFDIDGIEGAGFKFQSQLTLHPALNKFRKDRDIWKMINDRLIVTEVFYATSFTARFKVGSKVMTKVEVEDKLKKSADADLEWKNDEKLVVTNNSKVPFGVRGFTL